MRNKYDTLKAESRKPQLSEIDLIQRPHKNQDIILARFGLGHFFQNEKEMRLYYWNSQQYPEVTFRPATTSESISALAYKFARNGTDQKDPSIKCLQAGTIIKSEEGAYINPSEAIDFFLRVDERKLHKLRERASLVNGIWLGDNDFAFVPYESFAQGPQENEEFVRSGLARGLEHTTELVAPKLKEISSHYAGVGIYNMNSTKKRLFPEIVSFSLNREHFNVDGSATSKYTVGYTFGRKI